MFKEVESGIIESPEGFSINTHDHFELTYTEQDHVAKFYKEPGVDAYIHYLAASIRWNPPFENEVIAPVRQELIKDRIVAALEFRGYPVEIVR